MLSIVSSNDSLFFDRNLKLRQGAYLTIAPLQLLKIWDEIYYQKTGHHLPLVDPDLFANATASAPVHGVLEEAAIETHSVTQDKVKQYHRLAVESGGRSVLSWLYENNGIETPTKKLAQKVGLGLEEEVKPVAVKNPEYSLSQCAADSGFAEDVLRQWVRGIHRKGQAMVYGATGRCCWTWWRTSRCSRSTSQGW